MHHSLWNSHPLMQTGTRRRSCQKQKGLEVLNYVYACMWVLCGLILIVKMGKENRVFYPTGAFFLVLGAWWFLNELYPEVNMFEGVPGWILRGLGAVILVLLIVTFVKQKRQEKQQQATTELKKEERSDHRGEE